VRQISATARARDRRGGGFSVTLVLADDIDLARGDLIADAANPPREARSLGQRWSGFGDEPLRPGGRYLVQQSRAATPAPRSSPMASCA